MKLAHTSKTCRKRSGAKRMAADGTECWCCCTKPTGHDGPCNELGLDAIDRPALRIVRPDDVTA